MPNLTVVAVFRARPGKAEALGQGLLALVDPTRREAGNLRYEIGQSIDEPEVWLVQEIWCERADFDFHMSTPYVGDFMRRAPELCVGDPQLSFHELRSPAAA